MASRTKRGFARRLRRARWVFLVLAIATIANETAVGQTSGVDLAVTAVTVVGVQPAWIDGAPSAASYQVRATVQNMGLGPSAYRVQFFWQAASQSAPSPLSAGGADANTNPMPLAAGESREESYSWSLQAGQVGAGSVVAVVEPRPSGTVDGSPANNRRVIAVVVPSHAIDFGATGPAMEVQPGATAFFRFNAVNHGNVAESVDLSIVEAPDDSRLEAVLDPASLEVSPGSSAIVTLYVTYEPAGDFDAFAVEYIVQAATSFGKLLNATSPGLRDGEGTASASEFGMLFARAGTDPVVVPRPSEVTVPVVLTNTGTRQDDYTITTPIDARWTASVEPERFGLMPGEAATVNLRIRQTDQATLGERPVLNLSARPSLPGGSRLLAIPLALTGGELVVGLDPPAAPLYRGEDGSVNVLIGNRGSTTVREAIVELAVTQGPGAGAVLEQEVGDLAAGATTLKSFRLSPASGGNHTLRATVTLVDGTKSDAKSVSTFVHDPTFMIAAPTPKTGKPGENVTYSGAQGFLVTNTGATAEEVLVGVVVGNGTGRVDGDLSFELRPQESRRVNVVQRLPHPSGGLRAEAASLTVSIAATQLRWMAPVATAITDELPPTVVLRQPAPATWMLGRPLLVNFTIRDDDAIRSANVTILEPSGARVVVPLHIEAGKAQLRAVLESPGRYVIGAKAVDLHGNVGRGPDVKIEVEAASPLIRLANFKAGVVNATDWLRVEVEDVYGIERIDLTLVQGGRSVNRSLVLNWGGVGFDLRELGNGTATIVVAAVNTAGGRTETRIDVEVQGALVSELAIASEIVSRDAPLGFAPIAPLLAAWLADRLRRRKA